MFFGLDGKRVNVDTKIGLAGKVLVRLDIVEVIRSACSKTVLTVELEFSISDSGCGSVTSFGEISKDITGRTITNNPSDKLGGVIECQSDAVSTIDSRGFLGLNSFNQIFVGLLGKFLAFFSIKEDVINPERNVGKSNNTSCRVSTIRCSVIQRFKFNLDFNFVVLKSNQRKSKTRVTAESKKKGNVQCNFSRITISSLSSTISCSWAD